MTDEKGVQSIERALDIIESVAEEQDGKHLTAIAEETGLHKSTAHRIITVSYTHLTLPTRSAV